MNNDKMTRKRNMNKLTTKTAAARRKRPQTMGIQRSMFTQTQPGVARVRSAFELFNGSKTFAISYLGFNDWNSPARNLLTAFNFFRVVDYTMTVTTAGGTASPFTIAANVSNGAYADLSTTGILDDEYAGIANSATPLVVHPPPAYWNEGQMKWFYAIDPVAGIPTNAERLAGSLSFFGYGGTLPADVIGWCVVDMVIQFHTQS
jgi:hypothetical protein